MLGRMRDIPQTSLHHPSEQPETLDFTCRDITRDLPIGGVQGFAGISLSRLSFY
jgi:hypothetical protein